VRLPRINAVVNSRLILHPSTSGALLLRVVYGFSEDKNRQYPFVDTADQAVNDLYIAVSGFLVDAFPFCKCGDYFLESHTYELYFSAPHSCLGSRCRIQDSCQRMVCNFREHGRKTIRVD
jgi:hypothetical protein